MSQVEATSRWAREINIEQSHSQSYKLNEKTNERPATAIRLCGLICHCIVKLDV